MVSTTGAESGSTSTTTGMPMNSTGVDPSDTESADSSDDGLPGTTTDEATSTGADESSTTGPVCGDDVIEGGEECEGFDLNGADCMTEGFAGGMLSCTDCMLDTTNCGDSVCQNGVLEGEEACDQDDFGAETCASQGMGFDSGTLGCALTCDAVNTDGCGTCGNVIVDGTEEVCDDFLLLGQDCISQGFTSGTLTCAADCLSYVTDGCGTCGNDLIDGDELCDNTDNGGETCLTLGFDSGTLGPCQPSCTAFDTAACGTCGNDLVDGDEFCDGTDVNGETCVSQGFDNGVLGCEVGGCGAYDTSACGTCGDGTIDPSETCDGMNLGGETCASLGLVGGDLACSPSCLYDFSSCDIPGTPFGSDSGYNGYFLSPPMLPCDDISATGTVLPLTDDDQLNAPIGFTFPMYGVDFTDVKVDSNGALHFGVLDELSLTNQCLPTGSLPSDHNLYVMWDDLNPTVGPGEVYYETLGAPPNQRLVVQWDTAHYFGDAVDLMRFQVVLHEGTGQIEVCYPDTVNGGNAGDLGAEATSGIQNDAMDGFHYSCDTPDLTNGLMLLYLPI